MTNFLILDYLNFIFKALGDDVLKQLDELYKVVTPDEESGVPMAGQIEKASQCLVELFAASSKEFSETTCILSLNAGKTWKILSLNDYWYNYCLTK